MQHSPTRLDLWVAAFLICAAIIVAAVVFPPSETPDGPVDTPAVELSQPQERKSEDVCFDGNFDNDPPQCARR